ncbi:MAG: YdcF family protein [Firmicutes bacterium]|nr:YdcF family protein [Bacillota bacterium]
MKPAKSNLKLKRIIITVLLLIAVFAAVVLVINLIIIKDSKTAIIQSVLEARQAPVAIVLGCYVLKGDIPSAMLADRLDTGIELYRMGKVKKLLLTGDHGRINYDEVNTMRKYVLLKGIPPQDVFMDHAGFSTYDSLYRARDIFEVKKAIIVTQKYHLSRAIYTARVLGIDAVGVPADRRLYVEALLNETREALARAKAFIQLNIIHPLPRFLGPQIPITGDGRLTND